MRTITVGELRELLEDRDADELVIFSTGYGDYHNTPQALPLKGELEEVTIVESGYSNSGFAIASERDEDDVDDDVETEQGYLLIR